MKRSLLLWLVVASLACGTGNPAPGDPAPGDPVAGDHDGDPFAGDPFTGGDPLQGDPFAAGDPSGGDALLLTPCGLILPPVVVIEATVTELYEAIDAAETLAVVDVREPGETAAGIIEGALLYPWLGGELEAHHQDLPDDRPLYIICASGSRSRVAAQFLVDNGHTCVHTVLGGMGAWNTAGYPTVSP